MTTDQFNAKRLEIEDSGNRMAGLVTAIASLSALAFILAYLSPK